MKWLLRGLATLAIVFALSLAGIQVANVATDQSLKRTTQSMKETGLPTTPAELVPSHEASGQPPSQSRQEGTAFLFSNACVTGEDEVASPPESWNQVRTFVEAIANMTPKDDAEIRGIVQDSCALLEQLEAALSVPPASREEVIVRTGFDKDPLHVPYLDYPKCRWFADLLFLNAYVALLDDRPEAAVQSCSSLLRLDLCCRRFTHDRPGSVLEDYRPIRTLLPMLIVDQDLSNETLTAFALLLEEAGDHEGFVQIRVEAMVWLKTAYESPSWIAEGPKQAGLVERTARFVYASPLLIPLRSRNEQLYLDAARDMLRAVRQPFFQAKETYRALAPKYRNMRFTMSMARDEWEISTALAASQAEREVLFTQARIALALNRYKKETGAYPEALDALVPKYMTAVPTDVSSGKPMAYCCAEDTYVLYGAGFDGDCDLKLEGPEETGVVLSTGATVWPADDWVWGANDLIEFPLDYLGK